MLRIRLLQNPASDFYMIQMLLQNNSVAHGMQQCIAILVVFSRYFFSWKLFPKSKVHLQSLGQPWSHHVFSPKRRSTTVCAGEYSTWLSKNRRYTYGFMYLVYWCFECVGTWVSICCTLPLHSHNLFGNRLGNANRVDKPICEPIFARRWVPSQLFQRGATPVIIERGNNLNAK